MLIDFLMGETDGVPKDPNYIYRLYMALGTIYGKRDERSGRDVRGLKIGVGRGRRGDGCCGWCVHGQATTHRRPRRP
jgi:hypothetical protein